MFDNVRDEIFNSCVNLVCVRFLNQISSGMCETHLIFLKILHYKLIQLLYQYLVTKLGVKVSCEEPIKDVEGHSLRGAYLVVASLSHTHSFAS